MYKFEKLQRQLTFIQVALLCTTQKVVQRRAGQVLSISMKQAFKVQFCQQDSGE